MHESCLISSAKVYIISVMNSKERGNAYYKENKIDQAIQCYREYVAGEHPDNKNAYFNLGLCYYRLKQYPECVEVSKKALEIDPQYSKIYYRLALAYKQMKGQDYNVFINAVNFCNNCKESEEQEKQQVEKIVKQYKAKLSVAPPSKVRNQIDQQFRFILGNQLDNQKCVKQYSKKWEEITAMMEICDENYEQALNLAYLHIDSIESSSQKMALRDQLVKIKAKCKENKGKISWTQQLLRNNQNLGQNNGKDLTFAHRKQEMAAQRVVKRSGHDTINSQQKGKIQKQQSSSDENLFADSSEQIGKGARRPTEEAQSQETPMQIQLDLGNSPSKGQSKSNKSAQNVAVNQNTPLQQQSIQMQTEIDNQVITATKISDSDQKAMLDQSQVQEHYRAYILPAEKSSDVFAAFHAALVKLLSSEYLSRQMKRAIVNLSKTRGPKFSLYLKSFSSGEQQILYSILQQSSLLDLAAMISPKCVPKR